MTISTWKWTVDRYHQAVEAGVFDDVQVELLKGELVEMSPEGIPHAGLSSDAGDYLRDRLGSRAKVREGHPITLPNNSEPEPDLAIVEPLGEVYITGHHPYPENIFWIIEYSNTSLQKDLEIKSKVYAEAGIREYWVINLKTRELNIFRDAVNGEYQHQVVLTDGRVNPLAFPEVEVEVARLLRR
ncbi:Uma2 family endonuclease [Leptolyngbya sp. FACHB-17]|uniref:Uma2 family endonuclease n=1 Tax=unclassified Leptolyngbya TaxID=2650499 RepID=UPI001680EF50|nr:Uma2 family endonuclease [Leptolyngbya sp. FACHB-17]MBD2082651.1 Uma2 family endonuclease [Leptolyngbya sp. FACHB-17]